MTETLKVLTLTECLPVLDEMRASLEAGIAEEAALFAKELPTEERDLRLLERMVLILRVQGSSVGGGTIPRGVIQAWAKLRGLLPVGSARVSG